MFCNVGELAEQQRVCVTFQTMGPNVCKNVEKGSQGVSLGASITVLT